jgi:nucleoside-diphosphate-sugar epimerase
MNILLCGARGFIGHALRSALETAGHTVTGPGLSIDFCRDVTPAVWRPRLRGIDAVVNAVGVLRDTARRPMRSVHVDAPAALFDACAEAGVRRVVHVSALGIDVAQVPYAVTKRAAEHHLLAHTAAGRLDGVALRPSIVFGRGGASSSLFMTLARSPVLWAPKAMISARVQPVSVRDLADAVVRLLTPGGPAHGVTGLLPCVGPAPLTMAAFIVSLRRQGGHGQPWVQAQPDWLTRLSVAIGDRVTALPLCTETMALLAHDNVADPQAFAAVLGRPARPVDTLVQTSWNTAA